MDFKQYVEKISVTSGKKLADVGETKPFKAYLGDGTGTGNIRNTSGPYQRMINYWRDTTEGREIGTAILDSNANIPWSNITSQENTEVVICYPPRSKVPYAMRISREGTNQLPGGGISPTEQQISAAGYPFLRDITDFRASAQVPASLEAQVVGGLYRTPAGILTPWLGDDTSHGAVTLSSLQGALAAGEHRIGWIVFDRSTGELSSIGLTAVTAFGPLPARDEFDLPSQFAVAPGANQDLLLPVYLYYGQTGLVEKDFYREYDAREALDEIAIRGLATLVAGTVVVTVSMVTANSLIFLTPQETGLLTGSLRVSARIPGTSFTMLSTILTDTATVAWQILEP